MKTSASFASIATPGGIALMLRLGMAAVFITGGLWKLIRLLNPAQADGIVTLYTSSHGYINQFFQDYLFAGPLGSVLGPWGFLTALSTFELVTGLALVLGLLVRPIALIYTFLLWTFIIALPVHTVPDALPATSTFEAPALLVQIRDVALSGLMVVLFTLGAGRWSLDQRLFGQRATAQHLRWDALGLLTRLAMAAPLVVGGMFAVTGAVPTYSTPALILLAVGVMLASGVGVRAAGVAVALIMLWRMGVAFDGDNTLLNNLNAFKREFAFLATGIVLALLGGGRAFTPADIASRCRDYLEASSALRRKV